MPSGYQAGTVFVDVVPSMNGFYKAISADIRSGMPQAANEAGATFKDAFTKNAQAAGKDAANALTDPLGKSVPRLRQDAAEAGRALTAAQEAAASSGQALAAVREKEAAAAQGVEAAEQALAAARSSGSAGEVARAEQALAAARERSTEVNKKADAAATAHSKALGEVKLKSEAADRVTDELNRSVAAQEAGTEQAQRGLRGWIARLRESATAVERTQEATRTSSVSLTGFSSSLRSAVGPVMALGAAVGIGGFAGEAISASDATDKFKGTLKFAGLGTEEIEALTASTRRYADETVYDLSDIQSITAQLAANGVEGYDQLAEAAGNLNAVAGGSAETFKSVGMVMTQTAGQGKLTTENWNQLSDAIPGASGKIQEALLNAGAYTGNFRDALEKGEVSAQEFNAAVLELGSDETAQAAARSTTTIEGAAGNLQATIMGGVSDLISWLKPAITDAMGWVSDTLQGGIDWVKNDLAPGLKGVWDILVKGDFTGPVFGLEEDSAVVDWLFRLREAGQAVWDALMKLKDAAIVLWERLEPLVSAAWDLARAVGGDLLTNIKDAATWLGNLFDWVSRNSGAVSTLAAGVGTGVIAFRAFNAVQKTMQSINAAGSIMKFVQATKIGTMVQAAFNAVISANPIMILVAAIAALVAGLIYFFTQTETGKQVWESITQAFSNFIGWIGDAWSSTLEAVSSWWDSTWTTVKDAFQSYVVEPLTAAWDTIAAVFQTAMDIIGAVWDGIVTAAQIAIAVIATFVLVPLKLAVDALGAVFTWLWENAVRPAWEGIKDVLTTTWEGTIKPLWEAFTNTLGTVGDAVMSLWNDHVVPAWDGITSTVSTAAGWISDFLSGIWQGIKDTASTMWNALKDTLSGIWEGIKSVVSVPAQWVVDFLSTIWNSVRDTVSTVWNGIKSAISGVWDGIKDTASTAVNWVKDTVTNTFNNLKTGVENAFTTMKDAIKTVWDKIKEVTAAPINFVIKTVYTNGIKWAFDTVAAAVGLDLRLPVVNPIPGYAGGGQFRTMLPGYTPGRDVYHFYSPDGGGAIRMSGGEGIIRPDALRALGGERWLDAVNASGGRGLSDVGDAGPRRGQVTFAKGGIWGAIKGGFSAAVNWVKDTASAVADIVSDPVGAIVSLVTEPAEALLATMGESHWVKVVRSLPSQWWESIKNLFRDETEKLSTSDLVTAARKAIGVPYVWGGSSVPPGLDCSGLVYWAAQQLGWGWPRLTAAGYQAASTPVAWGAKVPGDLLFWGAPAHHVAIVSGPSTMVEEPRPGLSGREIAIWGSPTVGRYGGARKYDAGGLLPPGVHAAVNATGAPEAVLTARQWADVHALVDRGGADPDAIARALDGLGVSLVLDDGDALDAHIEVVASSVARRSRRLAGRGR